MPVFRVEKNTNYTTMSNYHLQDKNLTLKAKGLLSLCLSLPETWDYSVRGLVAICKEGKDSIVKILQELEQYVYLERHRLRRDDGKMGGIEYVIYEMPREPCMEKPDAGKPRPENPPQLNKEQLGKEESNTDSNKRKKEKEPRHQYGSTAMSFCQILSFLLYRLSFLRIISSGSSACPIIWPPQGSRIRATWRPFGDGQDGSGGRQLLPGGQWKPTATTTTDARR
ncbi:MAG: hypothetical protein LUG45_02455 [Clostridiales bacterium]|nr:hypothetical protein [Clostridiales bacterium]